MKFDEQLTYAEVFRFVEMMALGLFMVFTVYTNSKQVPQLVEQQASINIKVAVLSSQYGDIKDSLARIEKRLEHK